MASPPSFDAFFNSQQGPLRQTSTDSGHYSTTGYVTADPQQYDATLFAEPLSEDLQMGNTAQQPNPNHAMMRNPRSNSLAARNDVERKDSVPFDPTSSSTLIASASNGHQKPMLNGIQPPQMYQGNFSPDPNYQYGFQQHQQPQQQQHHQHQQLQQPQPTYHSQSPQPQYSPQPQQQQQHQQQHMQHQNYHGQTDYSVLQQGTSNDNYYDSTLTSAPQSGDWNNEFVGQQQQEGLASGDSRRASWNGSAHHLDTQYDEMDELQRIISNASSHAGTPGDSRVASPFLPPDMSPGFSNHIRHDSQSSIARSPSPYATPSMAAPSPPIAGMHRASTTSLSGSPSFSKPQSPPALIIPNHSPSPSLPPIMTTVAAASSGASNNAPPPGNSHFGNSLLPPANPALEHLTGMAGISPIAPNADGPMITIQPSTPISGLREGGGVFDAALRRANSQYQQNQKNQAQQGQQSQSNAQPSQTAGGQQDTANFNPTWAQNMDMSGLNVAPGMRGRSKSESYMTGETFDRQAGMFMQQQAGQMPQFSVAQAMQANMGSTDQWSDINAWRMNQAQQQGQGASAGGDAPLTTLDPRNLPGISQDQLIQQQIEQLQAQQRARLTQLNTETGQVFKYEPGQVSPTSMAFYQNLGLGSQSQQYHDANAQYASFLGAPEGAGGALGSRRRSFAEGSHPAAGAGTPGYGVEFTMPGASSPGRNVRGGQFTMGHRRAVKSEDFGRPGVGTGWGVGQGGSTADFLQSITNPNDGTLLPPSMRGRSMSHSRHSSQSSVRSASPALSVSSQGSSFSHHSHMDMPDGMSVSDMFPHQDPRPRVAKMKVTSMATEVASQSRRTNSGIFKCPIPGCGSTFTRHFNLKGHLRSHNDERPYKCLYDGCPKADVGFARQHDCKRHMLLHEGLRPFECEGCGKKFARLDALTRHHKSEQGQECAISHPLPTNPDGTAMSESQYKAYRLQQMKDRGLNGRNEFELDLSGDDGSGIE